MDLIDEENISWIVVAQNVGGKRDPPCKSFL